MLENTLCNSLKRRGCYAQARLGPDAPNLATLVVILQAHSKMKAALGANEADLETFVPAGR